MEGTDANVTNNQETQTNTETKVEINYEELANAIQRGQAQKERSVLKSTLKEQYGLSDDEFQAAVENYNSYKQKQAQKKETALSDLQKENARLKSEIYQSKLEKEAAAQAKELGIDAANHKYVMKMADFSKVKEIDGKLDSEAIKTAIEALITDMPLLKGEKKEEKSGFQNIGPDAPNGLANTAAAINKKRAAMGLKPIE